MAINRPLTTQEYRKKIPMSDQQIADAEETASGGVSLTGNTIRKPMPEAPKPSFFNGPPGAITPGTRNTNYVSGPPGATLSEDDARSTTRVAYTKPSGSMAIKQTIGEGLTGDTMSNPMPQSPERPVSQVKTSDQSYPVYKKGGEMSKSFNTAFGEARSRGDSAFEWEGRSYGTKLRKADYKPGTRRTT